MSPLTHRAQPTQADLRDMRSGDYCRSYCSVSYRCTGCGGIDELDPHEYEIAPSGIVSPAYTCPNVECQTTVELVLDKWTPFDLSDGGA